MNRIIYLIRHGKTPGNLEKRYIGITDEELSPEGIAELKNIHYPKTDIVFSSPLKRALSTAEVLFPEAKPIIIEDIRETDFGEFEGKNYDDLKTDPGYQAWIDSGGKAPFPSGESFEEANIRALKGFRKILELSQDKRTVSVVTHGGVIMAVLQNLFGGDYYDYHIENGKGYSFEISSDGLCSRLSSGLYTG
ncbi:MAG: histidine phosphatase family protein [Butyrivibrio sp.]|nr:histidine phosphatase family protein [Butyrivibrio sp.]